MKISSLKEESVRILFLLAAGFSILAVIFGVPVGLLTAGIILGVGRAIGETMAVIMVAGNQASLTGKARIFFAFQGKQRRKLCFYGECGLQRN